MTHILIVEDESRLRRDLADFLELTGYTTMGVATARDLRLTLAEGTPPDVVILDVGLPDGNGFELAGEIRGSHHCGIIMLTALGDSDDRIRGYESGADIYLVKHSTLREIEAAIRSLLRRTNDAPGSGSEDAGQWILDTIDWTLIAPNGHALKLTATEFAFMHLLCKRSGGICSRDELANVVARPNWPFDHRHLDAVVSRLRRKIEQRVNLPAPIKVVYGVGYTFAAGLSLS
ncbi:response regulator transcription factor [Paracoccus onubensis]|uniref:response regulator transcription factor n=1 Tax=Paracoccus onubensis TaxID=1675788 RepID=UPI00272F6664|nr:response regulator transcription factor [Paracoccus onubensis]MDP0927662.1 response regulator transcription factor [Paracoccus onubensis]